MRSILIGMLFFSLPALAQNQALFGSGKPPVFQEEELDRRFLRSKIHKALNQGTDDPNCAQVLRGLLTVFAEAVPMIHRRDDKFYVDALLWRAAGQQLSSPRFNGQTFVAAMIRRVLIDKALPKPWLDASARLNAKLPTIDTAKLKFLEEGLRPIDSFYFSLPALKERYQLEVKQATSAAATTAEASFRDNYLDRDVAWAGLKVVDITTRRKKDEPGLEATLIWAPPEANDSQSQLDRSLDRALDANDPNAPPPQTNSVRVIVKLAASQFVDVSKLAKGSRVLVRGRLWDVGRGLRTVEVREGLCFEDRDWAKGAMLAEPGAVAACPIAINELTGIAPRQPGGFAH